MRVRFIGPIKALFHIWIMPDRWAYIFRLLCVGLGMFGGLSLWCFAAYPFIDPESFVMLEGVAAFIAVMLIPCFLQLMGSHIGDNEDAVGFRKAWIECARSALLTGGVVGLALPPVIAVFGGIILLIIVLIPGQ